MKIGIERWGLRWSAQGEWNLYMRTDYIKFLKTPGGWTSDWYNCHLIPQVGFIFILTHWRQLRIPIIYVAEVEKAATRYCEWNDWENDETGLGRPIPPVSLPVSFFFLGSSLIDLSQPLHFSLLQSFSWIKTLGLHKHKFSQGGISIIRDEHFRIY